MGSSSVSSAVLVILNILNVVFGLALTAASIWFFIELQNVTSLRNQNHYLLDYNVYWTQAVPWIFLLSGVFVLAVSFCGFAGTKKQSRGVINIYIIFQIVALVLLLVTTVIALVFADSERTNTFVADTIWDAFTNMKSDKAIEDAFGQIERKYQCCGASGPRDYKNMNKGDNFPFSCCDTYYHSWATGSYQIDCDITNKLPNERLGCIDVASHYARIAIKVFSGAAVFTAFIGVLNLIVAFMLSRSLRKRNPVAVTAQNEFESKKVLL